jgi:hypothetical protein
MSNTLARLLGSAQTAALESGSAMVANIPAVQMNRARLAVLVNQGYTALEFYDRWRPTLFAMACAGAAISGAMAWRRRRVPEALALYLTTAGLGAATAWVTRPDALRGPPAELPPPVPGQEPAPGSLSTALGWADRHADHLSQTRPGWESATWQRLAQDLGLHKIDPWVATLLTQGSR